MYEWKSKEKKSSSEEKKKKKIEKKICTGGSFGQRNFIDFLGADFIV